MDQATLTVNFTVTLKPEAMETDNGITAEQKEANIKQYIQDQLTNLSNSYDFGINITGRIESSVTDPVDLSYSKPDYTQA